MSLKEFTVATVVAAMSAGTLDTKMVDKLSTGKVGATPERAKIAGKPVDIFMVFGEIAGLQYGVDKRTGTEWTALKGTFYGIKTDDPNTVYESGLLFLPAGQAAFEVATTGAGKLDAKDKPVYERIQFAVMAAGVPASNARGYSWELRNLIDAGKPANTSVQSQLLAKMGAKVAALAAPKAETK